jgi:hypothetical protein
MDINISPIRIHAFIGSAVNPQGHAIIYIQQRVALTFPNKSILWDIKYVKDIKGWAEEDLVSWLERSDIYLIPCHPHQGAPRDWIPEKLYALFYEKLFHRIGFPSKELLCCPIFRQDKMSYIHSANECFIPTLRIMLYTIDDIDNDWENIVR